MSNSGDVSGSPLVKQRLKAPLPAVFPYSNQLVIKKSSPQINNTKKKAAKDVSHCFFLKKYKSDGTLQEGVTIADFLEVQVQEKEEPSFKLPKLPEIMVFKADSLKSNETDVKKSATPPNLRPIGHQNTKSRPSMTQNIKVNNIRNPNQFTQITKHPNLFIAKSANPSISIQNVTNIHDSNQNKIDLSKTVRRPRKPRSQPKNVVKPVLPPENDSYLNIDQFLEVVMPSDHQDAQNFQNSRYSSLQTNFNTGSEVSLLKRKRSAKNEPPPLRKKLNKAPTSQFWTNKETEPKKLQITDLLTPEVSIQASLSRDTEASTSELQTSASDNNVSTGVSLNVVKKGSTRTSSSEEAENSSTETCKSSDATV